MIYFLINENGTCGGTTGVEPSHNNWTLTPYLGGLISEKWNGTEWIESATQEQIDEHRQKFINDLDLEYTQKISNLVEKYVQKNIIDGTPIPDEILEERKKLRDEYKLKLNNYA